VTLLATEVCEPPTLGGTIQVTPDEVRVSGMKVASLSNTKQIESGVFEKLDEMKRQFDDLHAQAGMEPGEPLTVTLIADENTPLAAFAAIARGIARTPTRRIEILSLRRSDPELWTRQAEHRHQCVVPVQLAADARPLSEFSDWPAFVRAADAARGTLKIPAGGAPPQRSRPPLSTDRTGGHDCDLEMYLWKAAERGPSGCRESGFKGGGGEVSVALLVANWPSDFAQKWINVESP